MLTVKEYFEIFRVFKIKILFLRHLRDLPKDNDVKEHFSREI
jgi:hypothetical protein